MNATFPSYRQNREWTSQIFSNYHNSTSIVKFTTVVWSTEQGDKLSFLEKLVSIFHNLVDKTKEKHVKNEVSWDIAISILNKRLKTVSPHIM